MSTVHWLGSGLSSAPGIRKLVSSGVDLNLWYGDKTQAQQLVISSNIDIPLKSLDWPFLEQEIKAGDIVVSMLPSTLHFKVAKICLAQSAHFVSSSYITPQIQSLDEASKSAKLSFVNEVGLDPGLDHLFAHALVAKYKSSSDFDKNNQHYFRSYCGGFPKEDNEFMYKFSWSPLGVLMALRAPAQWVENGETIKTDKTWLNIFDHEISMSDNITETFEAFPNRDSIPFQALYGFESDWNVKEFIRGTLRAKGWGDAWSGLFKAIEPLTGDDGVPAMKTISDDLFNRYAYDKGEPDRVVLSVELEVKDPQGDNVLFNGRYSIDALGDERGSAMSRLVSLNVAIAVETLMAGDTVFGVTEVPHDEKTVLKWIDNLIQLDENIFYT